MTEKIIEPGLSGEEIIEIALDHLRDLLRKAGCMRPNDSYQHMEGKITLALKLTDLGRIKSVERETVVRTRELPPPDAAVMLADILIEDKPENELRQEAGLPLPVDARDDNGRPTVKYAKYQRKERA